jgi:hypothetical protein
VAAAGQGRARPAGDVGRVAYAHAGGSLERRGLIRCVSERAEARDGRALPRRPHVRRPLVAERPAWPGNWMGAALEESFKEASAYVDAKG